MTTSKRGPGRPRLGEFALTNAQVKKRQRERWLEKGKRGVYHILSIEIVDKLQVYCLVYDLTTSEAIERLLGEALKDFTGELDATDALKSP